MMRELARRTVLAAALAAALGACQQTVTSRDGFAPDSIDAIALARVTIRELPTDPLSGQLHIVFRSVDLVPDPYAGAGDDPSRPRDPAAPAERRPGSYAMNSLAYPGAEEAGTSLAAGLAISLLLGPAAQPVPVRRDVVQQASQGLWRMARLSPRVPYHVQAISVLRFRTAVFHSGLEPAWATGPVQGKDGLAPTSGGLPGRDGGLVAFEPEVRKVNYLGDFELTASGDRLLLTGYGHDRAAAEAHLRANAPSLLDALKIVDLKPALAPRP